MVYFSAYNKSYIVIFEIFIFGQILGQIFQSKSRLKFLFLMYNS